MPQFQVCVHTSSPSTSLMSVARLCVCVQTWWSWMSCTSFQSFLGIPPCIWLCATLFWPPGTRTARFTGDIFPNTTCLIYFDILGFENVLYLLISYYSQLGEKWLKWSTVPLNQQTIQITFVFSKGGADCSEMCTAHHCPGVGACALCAGDGACAQLHDQEGPHQHRCAVSQTASAPRKIPLCECPHCTSLPYSKSWRYLVKVYSTPTCYHLCRRMLSSLVPGLQDWLLHGSCKTLALRLKTLSLLMIWLHTLSMALSWNTLFPFTGGGAWGKRENWRSGVGWFLHGTQCRSRGSDC